MGGAISNLDCRTELPDSSPTGLTGFSGEIGIVNIYDQLLDETAISEAFNRVATIGPTGLVVINIAFDDENDEVTLTWNSLDEKSYLVEYSLNLEERSWLVLDDIPIPATDVETTRTLGVPSNQAKLFFLIVIPTP